MAKWWTINNKQLFLYLIIKICIDIINIDININIMASPLLQKHNDFKLVVFSFDGFRPDYVDSERTPNLFAVAKNGVQGEMHSTFVTKTYPNHQSIVTGLYQPYHGIINNAFIDNEQNKQKFDVNNNSIYWWDQNNISVPIYIANQFYESNRYSVSIQWPGSIANYSDGQNHTDRQRVYYLKNFDAKADWFQLIDILMDWLTDSKKPANLAFVYYPEPDSHAHQFGPFSDEVYEQVAKLDRVVGYFRRQLIEKHLAHKTNVIYLSDHGMAEISAQRSLYIDKCDEYFPGLKYEMYGSSPVWSAIPISGPDLSKEHDSKSLDESVCDTLNECSRKYYDNKFHCTLQKDINEEFHYKNNVRILPLFIDADEGYDINYRDLGWKPKGYPIWGNHGYNASLQSMHALFLAQGPRFKTSYRHPMPFENIDLYPLMMNLLDIPLTKFPITNGTFEHVNQMLSNRIQLNDENGSMNNEENKWTVLFVYLMIGFLIIFTAGFCFVCISGGLERNYLRKNNSLAFSSSSAASSSSSLRLQNYLGKLSYSQQNNITDDENDDDDEEYCMFTAKRPTSHLNSDDDDDDDDNLFISKNKSNNQSNNHHQQQPLKSKNHLTDIDWDILGTGLDIDLIGQLNDEQNRLKSKQMMNDRNDHNHMVTPLNESVSLLKSNDIEDTDTDENDHQNDQQQRDRHKDTAINMEQNDQNTNKLIDI